LIIHNKIIYIFWLTLLLAGSTAAAQDLATAKQLWADKRTVAAKEVIDSYLADAGSEDTEGWLLKATIYSAISTDPQLKYLVADGRMDAFQAVKRAVVINAKLVAGQLKTEGFSIIQTIYEGCTSDGVAFFNAGSEKKLAADYALALDYFKNALLVSQFASEQGWNLAFSPNDSTLLYNAAQSAINAQKEDEAILYCKKIADKGICTAGSYGKADFENIYQWLVNYYVNKKDDQNLQLYASLAGKIYPQSLYFTTISIKNYQEVKNYPMLVNAYETALQRFPQQDWLRFSFCTDLFTYIYAAETSLKTKKPLYPKLERNLQAYINKHPDSARAYLLLGKHYYNKAAGEQKTVGSSKLVLSFLTQAIKSLKICTGKEPDPRSKIRNEAFQILISALKAAGRKGEADAAYNQMMGI
jgi:hypothetical protein